MLGSTSCSQHHQQQQSQELTQYLQSDPPVAGDLQHHHQRQLLLTCARYISQTNFTAAHRIATILSANSSPSGDSSERLIHSFTKALSLRLHPPPNNNIITENITENNDASLHASYLSLNQVTPFIRFSHLTANQAILEAIDQSHHNNIHILDFDIMHGFQWPPLMQAIADRHPLPTLRITATGTNINHLLITGDRLAKFAHSLGLTFRFYPLLLPHNNNNNNNNNNISDEAETIDAIINRLSAVLILPNETLAVNCVLYLHRFLINRDKLCLLLRKIKSMNPKVVTLAENEANHNNSIFISRFNEALNYYTAIFDSLEATLPPNSRERMQVEQVWFGREIADIVAAEGEQRRARHERFLSWEMMMRIAGFQNVSLSPFALTQAKLLLRLHYPSVGYNLEVVNDCFFLGWQNQPLFSLSSWH